MWICSVPPEGGDGMFSSAGEAVVCNPEETIVRRGMGLRMKFLRVRYGSAMRRRRGSGGGMENNLYQLGHRGYVTVDRVVGDCRISTCRVLSKINISSMVRNGSR
jgi:formamidase